MNNQRGVAQSLIIGIIALIVVAAGIIYFTSRGKPEEDVMMEKKEMMEGDGKMIIEEGSKNMMAGEGKMMPGEGKMMNNEPADGNSMMMDYRGEVLAGTQALLLDFNNVDYEAALQTDKLIVLYFYANWCPICRVEFPKMQAAFNELGSEKVIGFRVNYNDNETDDTEINLAREFGVAYQHTKVFLKNGARVLKSPEGWNQERYLTEINRFLTQ